jgi:hypothetical protein
MVAQQARASSQLYDDACAAAAAAVEKQWPLQALVPSAYSHFTVKAAYAEHNNFPTLCVSRPGTNAFANDRMLNSRVLPPQQRQ